MDSHPSLYPLHADLSCSDLVILAEIHGNAINPWHPSFTFLKDVGTWVLDPDIATNICTRKQIYEYTVNRNSRICTIMLIQAPRKIWDEFSNADRNVHSDLGHRVLHMIGRTPLHMDWSFSIQLGPLNQLISFFEFLIFSCYFTPQHTREMVKNRLKISTGLVYLLYILWSPCQTSTFLQCNLYNKICRKAS